MYRKPWLLPASLMSLRETLHFLVLLIANHVVWRLILFFLLLSFEYSSLDIPLPPCLLLGLLRVRRGPNAWHLKFSSQYERSVGRILGISFAHGQVFQTEATHHDNQENDELTA